MYSTPKSYRSTGSRGSRRTFTIPRGKLAAINRRLGRSQQRQRFATRSRTATATALAVRTRETDPQEYRGGSQSYFKYVKSPNSKVEKLASIMRPLSLIMNSSGVLNATVGKQKQDSIFNLYYPTDCQTMLTNMSSLEYGLASPTGYKTQDIYMKSVYGTIGITNSENADTRIVLYDVIWKKDIVNDADGNAGFLNTLITDGITDAGGGATGANVVGTRPYDSAAFTEYCSVKKTTRIILAPGQTHYHTVNYQPNQKCNAEHLRAQSNAMQAFGGLSYGLVCVHYGSPVKDNAGTGATTSATNLIYVSQMEYVYSFVPSNMTNVAVANTLATAQNTNLENPITGTSTAFAQV